MCWRRTPLPVLFMRFVIQACALSLVLPDSCLWLIHEGTQRLIGSACQHGKSTPCPAQVLAAAPRLRGYVLELLGDLVSRGIWAEPSQWRGWLMAAAQTAPDSFPAMLQARRRPCPLLS